MNPLDDARRLIEPEVEIAGAVGYLYCGGLVSEGHRMPCKLAAVPQIVAALEAAEALVGLDYVALAGVIPQVRLSARLTNALIAALRGDRGAE